jgi:hypothetical protein
MTTKEIEASGKYKYKVVIPKKNGEPLFSNDFSACIEMVIAYGDKAYIRELSTGNKFVQAYKVVYHQEQKGLLRSAYHRTLESFNRSLIYSTKKPTLPGCIVFVCANLNHAKNLAGWNHSVWRCIGKKRSSYAFLNKLDKSVKTHLHIDEESSFMEEVTLLHRIQ